MFFDFSDYSSALLIFFFHGIVFSSLLLIKGIEDGKKSNYWLASFVFLCALYIAPFMFGYAGWYTKQSYRDVLFYVPFQQLFLMPPLLFFYVTSLLNNSFTFRKSDWIHLIPALCYLVYSLVIWITDKLVLGEYYFYANGRDKDLDLWYQIAGFILMVFYLFKCLKLYNQYKKNTSETVSFADSILFSWIQKFLFAFLFLLLIRILFFILNPEWANFGSKFWYYLSFSVLFYYISISGYVHAIKMDIPFRYDFNFNQSLDQLFQVDKKEENSIDGGTEEGTVDAVYDEKLKVRIENLMNDSKDFKNPQLTLFDIAQTLGTHPKKVSNAINKGFNMNFNDFVNTYRTLEVIKIVESEKENLKTLLGIAFDSGFNSKSTFNRAFKKHTSRTPKEYFRKKASK